MYPELITFGSNIIYELGSNEQTRSITCYVDGKAIAIAKMDLTVEDGISKINSYSFDVRGPIESELMADIAEIMFGVWNSLRDGTCKGWASGATTTARVLHPYNRT